MRESCAVGGIVFSKNIAHKGMPTSLSSPRILLLRCSLVYQRVEGKLISLEPVIMQVSIIFKPVFILLSTSNI